MNGRRVVNVGIDPISQIKGSSVTADVSMLVLTALSVGFFHTILGPDHYVPFAAMSRSNQWSGARTFWVTLLCGVGHILGSVLLGIVGIVLGTMLFQVESIESFRGDAAAWLLIGFGVAYLAWGVVRAVRDIPHQHLHSHSDGTVHSHLHQHDLEHRHLHRPAPDSPNRPTTSMTPWVLFLIFAFGPCEVLVPLLMYPAAEANWMAVGAVVLAFAAATLVTMIAAVMMLVFGAQWASRFRLSRDVDWHRYGHAVAGMAVLLCGVMVKFGL